MRVIGGALGMPGVRDAGRPALHLSLKAAGLPTNAGFELAFWLCTIGLVAATVVAALVPSRRVGVSSASITELA